MEFKTKYNIGDKVWTMYDDKPVEFTIAHIEIHKFDWVRPTLICYSDDSIEDIGGLEEGVFPTKEELLMSYEKENQVEEGMGT